MHTKKAHNIANEVKQVHKYNEYDSTLDLHITNNCTLKIEGSQCYIRCNDYIQNDYLQT